MAMGKRTRDRQPTMWVPTTDRAIEEIKLLATPLDFDDLIARGILKKAGTHSYWLLVPLRDLPDGFTRRIAAGATSSKGMKVRFWSVKRAAKLARKLGVALTV